MGKKKIKFFLLTFFLIIFAFTYFSLQNQKKKKPEISEIIEKEENSYNLNTIKDVKYFSTDENGNEYIIQATTGEIDQSNTHIIYLTKVKAIIKSQNTNNIIVLSDFGKYNSKNFDTIFSKNVVITYTNNEIKSDYLDFSIKRNSMIISKNVIYKNLNNLLKADTIEVNLKTKDTKIFMYENNKKVNINNNN